MEAIGKQQMKVQPENASELANRFVQADNAMGRLHDRLSALEDRLIPVLVPTPEVNEATSNTSRELLLSPFGKALHDLENLADHASARLDIILRELAL